MKDNAIERLKSKVGQELGVTPPFTVTQKEADLFSALTDDWDYMHNDPKWAANSLWGTTIAHGMYVLAHIPSFLKQISDLPIISDDASNGLPLNYGFDKVRFVSPLPVGKPARAHIKLLDVSNKGEDGYLVKTQITVFREDDKEVPMMIAENIGYFTFKSE